MKHFILFLLPGIFVIVSCQHQSSLNDQEKASIVEEIHQFMKDLDAAASSVNEEKYSNMFSHTDELAIASQGKLITSSDAIRDTIHAHMSLMQKQTIKTTGEKIFIIDAGHAVISTSKFTKITFINGVEIEMPYALTLFLLKRNGEWKIIHYHN